MLIPFKHANDFTVWIPLGRITKVLDFGTSVRVFTTDGYPGGDDFKSCDYLVSNLVVKG